MRCRTCGGILGADDYVRGDYYGKGIVTYLCKSCNVEWTFIRVRESGILRGETWELKSGVKVKQPPEEAKPKGA